MKICIPTLDDRGMEGMPSDHFGSAPYFTFVDTDTGEVESQRNGGAHHVHGACRPLDFLGPRTVDAVLCRGLGKRAFSRLQSGGVTVYVTLEKDVGATMAAFKEGRLRKLTSEEACHGHDHASVGGLGRGRNQGGGFGHGSQSGRIW
jgi:predicted Fe-Mo cluster-binding NifX family protein